MFSNLNPDELEIVLGAMQKFEYQPGQKVINQGDDGDNLYVVETGKLACSKVMVSFVINLAKVASLFVSGTWPGCRASERLRAR